MNNKHIAAIFDVDGTLIASPTTERIFIRFLLRRGELGWREMIYITQIQILVCWAYGNYSS
jgi:phosphoserine phosphatase